MKHKLFFTIITDTWKFIIPGDTIFNSYTQYYFDVDYPNGSEEELAAYKSDVMNAIINGDTDEIEDWLLNNTELVELYDLMSNLDKETMAIKYGTVFDDTETEFDVFKIVMLELVEEVKAYTVDKTLLSNQSNK